MNNILQSFLNTVNYLFEQIDSILASEDLQWGSAEFNGTAQPLLLQSGLQLDSQFMQLDDLFNQSYTFYNVTDTNQTLAAEADSVAVAIWYQRLLMAASFHSYIVRCLDCSIAPPLLIIALKQNFMDNETISDETQQMIGNFQTNFSFTYQVCRLLYNIQNAHTNHIQRDIKSLYDEQAPNVFYDVCIF